MITLTVIEGGRVYPVPPTTGGKGKVLPWHWNRVRWRLLPLSMAQRNLAAAIAVAEASVTHPQRPMARAILRGLAQHSPYDEVASTAAIRLLLHFDEVAPGWYMRPADGGLSTDPHNPGPEAA
ncbi:hypothetical protein [Oceanibaculum nanhaiense]|uniref:hypothetical protein n=1 Tax=Oceanibaculum nanhaiense TaxID=1909734 RepID=UPI003D2C032B